MRMTFYDPVADVLTITLAQPSQGESVESLEVDPGVFCDFQGEHRLLRVQVQDASRRYSAKELGSMTAARAQGEVE